jgi:hypothetical protein
MKPTLIKPEVELTVLKPAARGTVPDRTQSGRLITGRDLAVFSLTYYGRSHPVANRS